MHLLLIVHTAPSSTRAAAALQLAASALAEGLQVTVFFHADGVYHALPVQAFDPGLQAANDAYLQLAMADDKKPALHLLLCRASLSRRTRLEPAAPWQQSGLIELAELLHVADRVISFAA